MSGTQGTTEASLGAPVPRLTANGQLVLTMPDKGVTTHLGLQKCQLRMKGMQSVVGEYLTASGPTAVVGTQTAQLTLLFQVFHMNGD